jgi:hypothetical protein
MPITLTTITLRDSRREAKNTLYTFKINASITNDLNKIAQIGLALQEKFPASSIEPRVSILKFDEDDKYYTLVVEDAATSPQAIQVFTKLPIPTQINDPQFKIQKSDRLTQRADLDFDFIDATLKREMFQNQFPSIKMILPPPLQQIMMLQDEKAQEAEQRRLFPIHYQNIIDPLSLLRQQLTLFSVNTQQKEAGISKLQSVVTLNTNQVEELHPKWDLAQQYLHTLSAKLQEEKNIQAKLMESLNSLDNLTNTLLGLNYSTHVVNTQLINQEKIKLVQPLQIAALEYLNIILIDYKKYPHLPVDRIKNFNSKFSLIATLSGDDKNSMSSLTLTFEPLAHQSPQDILAAIQKTIQNNVDENGKRSLEILKTCLPSFNRELLEQSQAAPYDLDASKNTVEKLLQDKDDALHFAEATAKEFAEISTAIPQLELKTSTKNEKLNLLKNEIISRNQLTQDQIPMIQSSHHKAATAIDETRTLIMHLRNTTVTEAMLNLDATDLQTKKNAIETEAKSLQEQANLAFQSNQFRGVKEIYCHHFDSKDETSYTKLHKNVQQFNSLTSLIFSRQDQLHSQLQDQNTEDERQETIIKMANQLIALLSNVTFWKAQVSWLGGGWKVASTHKNKKLLDVPQCVAQMIARFPSLPITYEKANGFLLDIKSIAAKAEIRSAGRCCYWVRQPPTAELIALANEMNLDAPKEISAVHMRRINPNWERDFNNMFDANQISVENREHSINALSTPLLRSPNR